MQVQETRHESTILHHVAPLVHGPVELVCFGMHSHEITKHSSDCFLCHALRAKSGFRHQVSHDVTLQSENCKSTADKSLGRPHLKRNSSLSHQPHQRYQLHLASNDRLMSNDSGQLQTPAHPAYRTCQSDLMPDATLISMNRFFEDRSARLHSDGLMASTRVAMASNAIAMAPPKYRWPPHPNCDGLLTFFFGGEKLKILRI